MRQLFFMVPIPDGVDPRTMASAGDNIADAWRTVAPPLTDKPGAKVLVVGWGNIGLFAVAIAHVLGAKRVDYLDHDPHRLSVAGALGGRAIQGDFSTRPGPTRSRWTRASIRPASSAPCAP